MASHDDPNVLVFYLLDDKQGVSATPTTFFAAETPELAIDEHTPRFVCQHLTAHLFNVEEPLMLKVVGRRPFMSSHLSAAATQAEGESRTELELLTRWMGESDQPTVAYEWQLGSTALEPWRRPDDLVSYWDEMAENVRSELLSSGVIAANISEWFQSKRALPRHQEDALYEEVLAATAESLPFYEYVFRSIVTGQRSIDGDPELLRYRACDRTAKMFIRFPTYMSRRFLRRDYDRSGSLRARYLELLATAFQFGVAPLGLDRFCDYLSAKADCHGQERADLAWFVGELSILGRPRVPLGVDPVASSWLNSGELGMF